MAGFLGVCFRERLFQPGPEMNKEDLLLILLAVFLLIAILITIFFGGNQSRHGYGQDVPTPVGGKWPLYCALL